MSRKIGLLIVTVLTVVLVLSGCGAKKKIENSITKGILEKAAEASGEDVDIDLNNDEVTYKTDEGTMTITDEGMAIQSDGETILSGGEYSWPEGKAADLLPKFDKGTINYVLNSDENFMLIINETSKEDYTAYVDKVKEAGYTIDSYEMSSTDMEIYTAYLNDKTYLSLSYSNSDGSTTIAVQVSQ